MNCEGRGGRPHSADECGCKMCDDRDHHTSNCPYMSSNKERSTRLVSDVAVMYVVTN